MNEQQLTAKPEDTSPTALEEQISKGRKFVWKHSEMAKVFKIPFYKQCFTLNNF